MTLKEEIAELKKRVAELESAPRHESHYHYHYPQTIEYGRGWWRPAPWPQPWITWCDTGTATNSTDFNGIAITYTKED